MSQIKLLKKIVSKNLIKGKIKDFAAAIGDDQGEKELYKIVGQVKSYKIGESNFGPWTSFHGDFEAYVDDTIFKSGVAFIQQPLEDMIKCALDLVNEEGNKINENVEFGLNVSVKRRDDLEVGYEYIISPIFEVKQSDALSHLRVLALPSGDKVEKPVDKVEKPVDKVEKPVDKHPKESAKK